MRTESPFPYPIQYFSCKEHQKDFALMQKEMQLLTSFCLGMGAVTGETGLPGLRLDFNGGLRLQIPAGDWHITIGDHDSGMIFYDQDVAETILVSLEKYYIHWQIDIYFERQLVFSHVFDPAGKKVRIVFWTGGMGVGDILAALPYVREFQRVYKAKVSYLVADAMKELCQRLLSEIPLQEKEDDETYATYLMDAAFNAPAFSPVDGRMVPIQQLGQVVLGLSRSAPPLKWQAGPRKIKEPYVCIGVQASRAWKGWLYPGGWDTVIDYLKTLGYRVLCIDKNSKGKTGTVSVNHPLSAEDFTGNIPLTERAELLSHADFFIGLASGLAWLSATVGCPAIMLTGFTFHGFEFPSAYRVSNRLACEGCYNDVRLPWPHKPCPRHAEDSDKYLECSKKITPRMVIQTIDRLIEDKNLRKNLL